MRKERPKVVCYLYGCGDAADRHHICSRGSSAGRADIDDEDNILLLCRWHHTEIHQLGWKKFANIHLEVRDKIIEAREKRGRRV